MKTLAFDRDLAQEIIDEKKAENARTPFRTRDNAQTGWFIDRCKCPETKKMVPRATPAFTFNEFFLVNMGHRISMFVLNTSLAGKVTAWEYFKPIDNLNTARAVAFRICMPDELAYSYFRTKTYEGADIWRVNSKLILSERQMEKMNIPAFMREQSVNQARQYQEAGSLGTLECLTKAPPADGPLTTAFPKVVS
jgi:hypothetical protein